MNWESVSNFLWRTQIKKNTFARRIQSADCPEVETREGPTGRIKEIKSNPEFERFCKERPKKKELKQDLPTRRALPRIR